MDGESEDPFGGAWQVGVWVVVLTVGVLVLGTVFGTAAAAIIKVAVTIGGLAVGFVGACTDITEPPRGRISAIRSPTKGRPTPRRKRRQAKGAARRTRR